MPLLELPHKYKSRPYQKEFFEQVYDYNTTPPTMVRDRGVMILPRRHGKDKSIFNEVVIPEMLKRVGLYYYVFPEQAQARKAFWENIDNDGFKLINHIPKELIKNKSDSEMKIELHNGSILRVVGTDKNVDGIVGSNPVGCIFSEFAIANPIVWDLVRPMLLANKGRAYFVYTPRGKNHGRDLYQTALKHPDRYALILKTAKETLDWDGNRIFTDDMLQSELDEGMDQNLFEQEYFCSFDASLKGAVYDTQLKELFMAEPPRVCSLPYEQGLPVHTFWDLGVGDATSIWFAQFYGKEIRLIDHYEATGKGIGELVDLIRNKGYTYGEHWLPHDADYRVQGAIVETKRAMFERLGLKNIKITPKLTIDDGIQATRQCFRNMWFDKDKCEYGLNALKSYVYDYDDKKKIWSKEPKHDWASHTADALRYLGVVYNTLTKPKQQAKTITPDYSKYL